MDSLGELLKGISASSDGDVHQLLPPPFHTEHMRNVDYVDITLLHTSHSGAFMSLSSDENDWICFAQDMFMHTATHTGSIQPMNIHIQTHTHTHIQTHNHTHTLDHLTHIASNSHSTIPSTT
ncbi:hypothetical protein EON65_44935, partial [archaeon]